jgi:penicillin-insensitive murein endopeptidase
LAAAALLLLACSRVPSPLTPSVRGPVGLPHHGLLTDAVLLPRRGTGYEWLDPGGQHHGTSALVSAIQFAAERVARLRPGGPPLRVGDLSAPHGGKLRGHASHRTGRDADLLFYATTLSGQPALSPGWAKFGPDGLGPAKGHGPHAFVQLDLDRNWLLVRSLLEAPGAHVVWLFVSRPLEALLTEHALARGEDPELVWHAESVMLQPRNALPHDDHFHLRIACPGDSAVAGCEDIGPEWPWLPKRAVLAWPEREEEIAALLGLEPPAADRGR